MNNNYLFLPLQFRLRWYKSEMLHKLMRYKHALIILAALLIPDFQAVSSLILSPIKAVIMGDVSMGLCCFSLVSLQIIFIIWTTIQKPAIMGTPFRSYIYTLPVSSFHFIQIDLLVLLVANLILWIPFVFVFFEIKNVTEFLRFFIVISALITSQILFLHRSFRKFITIIIFDLLFVLSSATQGRWLSLILIVMSFGTLFIVLLPTIKRAGIRNSRIIVGEAKQSSGSRPYHLKLPWEVAILIRHSIFAVSMRIVMLLIIAFLGSILLKYSAMNLHYWNSLQCLLTLITCLGSALFALLYENGNVFRMYLKTLPCYALYWNAREFLAGAAPSFSVSIFFLCAQGLLNSLSFFQGLVAALAQIPLQILLYGVRIHFIKQGTFLSFLISFLWGGFLIMCVNKGYL